MSKISLIIQREYLTRIQKKSFILLTLLSPIIMVALIFVPAWLSQLSGDKTREIAIIDSTGLYEGVYQNSENYQFTYTQETFNTGETLNEEREQPYAYVIINDNLLVNPQGMTIYSQQQVTGNCEQEIILRMEEYLRKEKLLSYNIPNIQEIINESNIVLHVHTIRFEDNGEETQTSSEMVMTIGMVMTFIIYIFLLLYGGQVMSSITQEKTNRIVEVMVSSVKPFQLMMGKIISIGLVGLTQLAIWILFAVSIYLTIGELFPMNESSGAQLAGTSSLQGIITILGYFDLPQLLTCFILFFIGGYILYASLFAAIGSAVDSESDTQQFMVPITFIIIFALYAGIFSAENPDGPLSQWCSMIPFTSPIVMMVRVPFGVPMWELGLSIAILYASAIGLAWIAGRIYRVGILMYGKKASYKEMIKWIRYKA